MWDAYVSRHAGESPRALAVVTPGRRAAYAELDAQVDALAAHLAAQGLGPGSGVVAIRLMDRHLHLTALLALARLGVVSSPGEDPAPDLRLTDGDPGPPGPALIHVSREALDARAAPPPRPVLDPDAPGRVMVSSGTTRAPRRVAMSWRQAELGAEAYAAGHGARRTGVWIAATGPGSMLGFTLSLAAWSCGAAAAWFPDPAGLPARIEQLRPTLIGLVPIHLRRLLEALPPGFAPQPGLRVVVAGGPLPPAVARAARLTLTPDLHVAYGATEAGSGVLTAPAALLEEAPGLAGRALPGVRVEVVDDEGRPVPPGVQGRIRLAGPRTAAGYLGDAEGTAAAFRDGWFHPGDLGRLTADGLLYVDGRLDERMNLGGLKALPDRLDEAALAVPGVADAAAFACPDAEGLDACWLAVVRGEGFERERLLAGIADPDLPPCRLAFVAAIPRNAAGKPDRRALGRALAAVIPPANAGPGQAPPAGPSAHRPPRP